MADNDKRTVDDGDGLGWVLQSLRFLGDHLDVVDDLLRSRLGKGWDSKSREGSGSNGAEGNHFDESLERMEDKGWLMERWRRFGMGVGTEVFLDDGDGKIEGVKDGLFIFQNGSPSSTLSCVDLCLCCCSFHNFL